jgi:hypothetical protein
MAADIQILTNRLKVRESTGPGRPPMEKPAPNLNTVLKKQSQFQKVRMRLNSMLTKDYEKNIPFGFRKNKANSKPNASLWPEALSPEIPNKRAS